MNQRFAKMVDISEKSTITRTAVAEGRIVLGEATIKRIEQDRIEKGDPLQIASVAAIQAVKSTPSSVMLCHPISIESARVEFSHDSSTLTVKVAVLARSKTGVEIEALNGVACALLNIWDVVKKYEKDSRGQYPETRIENIRVVKKIKDFK